MYSLTIDTMIAALDGLHECLLANRKLVSLIKDEYKKMNGADKETLRELLKALAEKYPVLDEYYEFDGKKFKNKLKKIPEDENKFYKGLDEPLNKLICERITGHLRGMGPGLFETSDEDM